MRNILIAAFLTVITMFTLKVFVDHLVEYKTATLAPSEIPVAFNLPHDQETDSRLKQTSEPVLSTVEEKASVMSEDAAILPENNTTSVDSHSSDKTEETSAIPVVPESVSPLPQSNPISTENKTADTASPSSNTFNTTPSASSKGVF